MGLKSSKSGRNFDTGSSKVYSARGSFEPGMSPYVVADITPRQSLRSRAMSGNFVMTAADVDRVVHDGQRSARDGQRSSRRSLDRSGRNSMDRSLRMSGKQSVRLSLDKSIHNDDVGGGAGNGGVRSSKLNIQEKHTNSGKVAVVDHDAPMDVEDFEEIDDLPRGGAPLTTAPSQTWREQKTMNFPGAMV